MNTTVGFTAMNAPQKVTASATALADELHFLTNLKPVGIPQPSIWCLTEVADADRAGACHGLDGITTMQEGGPGKGECAILTRDSRWTVNEQHWFQLTDGGGKARLSQPIVAPAEVLEGPHGHLLIVTNCHLPAHLEGIWAAIQRRDPRILSHSALLNPVIATWVEAVKEWRTQIEALQAKYPQADVLVFADWNLSILRKWVRRLVKRTWPGLNVVATTQGDLGHRVIGWGLTTMTGTVRRVYESGSSDHRVGRYTLVRSAK